MSEEKFKSNLIWMMNEVKKQEKHDKKDLAVHLTLGTLCCISAGYVSGTLAFFVCLAILLSSLGFQNSYLSRNQAIWANSVRQGVLLEAMYAEMLKHGKDKQQEDE